MSRAAAQPQLNIRSRFARERVAELSRRTGMSAAEIAEEALRAYTPPAPDPVPPGFIRKGLLLVVEFDGRIVTHDEVEAAMEEDRNARGLVEP